MGGGGSRSASSVNNEDKRVAAQGGAGVSGDQNSVYSVSNDTDVVKAIAQLGTDAIQQTGAAIVNLNENNAKLQSEAWTQTLTTGEKLVSKLADGLSGDFALANKSIDAFQPTENKQAGAAMWVGLGAIGLIAIAVLKGR